MAANSVVQELEEVVGKGLAWMTLPEFANGLGTVFDRRLAALEQLKKEAPKPHPIPVLFAGDVIRLAGWSRLDMLVEHFRDDTWKALSLSGREVYSNIKLVVEVYRGGKQIWKLPEPEGGYRNE